MSGTDNAGIDSLMICAVIRVDFPLSILDLIQELGRAGHNSVASSKNCIYYIFFSLGQFLYLVERIHNPEDKIIDSPYTEDQFLDSMEVACLFGLTGKCYFQEMELLFGNPKLQRETEGQCGSFPNF
eukprot:14120996-Ditylum_brightwellii.AAC.1